MVVNELMARPATRQPPISDEQSSAFPMIDMMDLSCFPGAAWLEDFAIGSQRQEGVSKFGVFTVLLRSFLADLS